MASKIFLCDLNLIKRRKKKSGDYIHFPKLIKFFSFYSFINLFILSN